MLRDGNAAPLYDLKLQERYQSRFDIKIRDGALPYNHPAYQLLIFLPLSRFDYTTAFLIWGAINGLLIIGIGTTDEKIRNNPSEVLRPHVKIT